FSIVDAVSAAAFSAGHGHDPQYFSPDRTRSICDESPEARRPYSRCRPRGSVLRPGTSHPLAQTSDRPNPGEDHWPGRPVVVFVQNRPLSISLLFETGRSLQRCTSLVSEAAFERRRRVPKLDTYLSFDGTAAEAMRFYEQMLGAKLEVLKFGDAPNGTG